MIAENLLLVRVEDPILSLANQHQPTQHGPISLHVALYVLAPGPTHVAPKGGRKETAKAKFLDLAPVQSSEQLALLVNIDGTLEGSLTKLLGTLGLVGDGNHGDSELAFDFGTEFDQLQGLLTTKHAARPADQLNQDRLLLPQLRYHNLFPVCRIGQRNVLNIAKGDLVGLGGSHCVGDNLATPGHKQTQVAAQSEPGPGRPIRTVAMNRIACWPIRLNSSLPKDYAERVRWMGRGNSSPSYRSVRRRTRLTCGQVLASQDSLIAKNEPVVINGRIRSIRKSGSQLWFLDVVQNQSRLQVLLNGARMSGDKFALVKEQLQRGDIIEAEGVPVKSANGQFSLELRDLEVLTPCLHNYPDEKTPITDTDLRNRNRHHDLLCNPESVRSLMARAHVIQWIRGFLLERGHLEVETPILSAAAGGAVARPFETSLNDHGEMRLRLRVAPELYLKRLVIGGLDRVFEIGRVFRNEGMDCSHHPEFTTCEFYEAYGTVEETIGVVEEMISRLVPSVQDRFGYGSERPKRPFVRIDVMEELGRRMGPVPWEDEAGLEGLLTDHLETLGLPRHGSIPQKLDRLIGHWIESSCQQPTFLLNHPLVLSPLAKGTGLASNRFELFIGGRELANGYEELGDPFEQRLRFQTQSRLQGREEGALPDESFVDALMTGLPPTIGCGIGIDRLVAWLVGSGQVRDVIAFPLVRNKLGP